MEWVFIIKPQITHFKQLQVNSPHKNSFKYTIGWGVASKYSDSTICFGQDSASYVTNKANGSQIPCAELSTLQNGLNVQALSNKDTTFSQVKGEYRSTNTHMYLLMSKRRHMTTWYGLCL